MPGRAFEPASDGPFAFAIRRIARGSRPARSAASSIIRIRSPTLSSANRGSEGSHSSASRPAEIAQQYESGFA